MKRLDYRHTPKGTLISPVKRAIVDWLREHGPATCKQVHAAMDARGFDSWQVSDGVYSMRKTGHLERMEPRLNEELLFRVAGSNAVAPAEPTPIAAPSPRVQCSVAAPRRIDVMRAPPLVGENDAPAREGAMDYAAIPSLVNGQRVPRRTGRAAP